MKLIKTELGKERDGTWCWRARGFGLAEFCGVEAWQVFSDAEGWIYGGPFRSRRAAERACKTFEREFFREMYPIEIKNAPVRTLH
jgi:hypothetical protein